MAKSEVGQWKGDCVSKNPREERKNHDGTAL